MHPLVVGFGLGFFVALQLGPMSLLLVRSTLRVGWRVGLAIGAGIALALGARTLYSAFRVRHGGEIRSEVATPGRAFVTALAGTASNPATIASWAAIFAAASAAGAADSSGGALLLVAGVGAGSLVWTTLLASGTAIARRAIGERAMRVADGVAGLGLIGFGGALAYDASRDA